MATQSLRMQARGDFGSKWFDVVADNGQPPRVTENVTPFPESLLIEGLLGDQALMYMLPDFKVVNLWRYADGTVGLRCSCGDGVWEYIFEGEALREKRELQRGHAIRVIIMKQKAKSDAPLVQRVTNYALQYTSVSETITSSH